MYYYYKHCYRVITIIQSTLILYSHSSRSVLYIVRLMSGWISLCSAFHVAMLQELLQYVVELLYLHTSWASDTCSETYILRRFVCWDWHVQSIYSFYQYYLLMFKGSYVCSDVFITNRFIRTAVKADNIVDVYLITLCHRMYWRSLI